MIVQGVLRRDDLGPGAWVLVADDGKEWMLDGEVSPELSGAKVRAEGTPADSFGFAMNGGGVLSLSTIRRL